MAIKGINTAPILQNNRLCLIAFKLRDDNKQERLFFMQIPTLIDFLVVLKNSTLRVSQRLASAGEEFKMKLIADNEALAGNIPVITQAEVTQPDPGMLVTSIAPKVGDEYFSLIAFMHNEHVITFEIDDNQAEFILVAIKKAIEVTKDNEALRTISAFMSFILLYDVNLADSNKLQYNEFKHELWKQNSFSQYLAVLYCFDTEHGKQLLAGNVIKINGELQSQETEALLQFIYLMTPTSKLLRDKNSLCNVFTQVINAPTAKALTKDECLRALHNFYLEKKIALE